MSLISLSLSLESYDSQSPTPSSASSVSPSNNNNNNMFKLNTINYKNSSAILQLNFQDLELSHNDGMNIFNLYIGVLTYKLIFSKF
jgi:hypothetical protein